MISTSPYRAAREQAARIDRSDRGRIVVSGADRASYLHGLLTNDITSLKAGEGCYAAYLTAQGRMIADLFVYELGDVILLSVPIDQRQTVLDKLDQFVFSEDVQLGDATASFSTVSIIGPDAARVVGTVTGVGTAELAALPEHGNRRARHDGGAVIITRESDCGEAGYDVHVEASMADSWRRALDESGVPLLDNETADAIRIEAGVPRFGRDMDHDTIPLEAGIESRAISFSKGCYVGQEVIIRVMHRGHGRVVRKLVGLVFEGSAAPAAGAVAQAEGRTIGSVTSSARSPALEKPIALAYLHRDFLAPGTTVSVEGMTGVVTELPLIRGVRL